MPQVQAPAPGTLLTPGTGGRIAGAAEAMLKEGARYGYYDIADKFTSGSNKCNKFVHDALVRAGIDAPVYPGKDKWPYVAEAWGNPKLKIPGWIIVDASEARAGDVVAQRRTYRDASGHTGIVLGQGKTMAAHGYGLGVDRFGFESDPKFKEPIVFRRYVGTASAQ